LKLGGILFAVKDAARTKFLLRNLAVASPEAKERQVSRKIKLKVVLSRLGQYGNADKPFARVLDNRVTLVKNIRVSRVLHVTANK
jgi:hypothetical protein